MVGEARLVLWDVDHTLILADDFHALLYRDAFRRCFGREPDQLIKMSGRTDLDSMTETLGLNGIEPTDECRAAFSEALVEAMASSRAYLRQHGRQARGAADVLRRLREVPGVIQSAVTGNLKPLAVAKLGTLGLEGYLDFDVGGFGGDHEDRSELVRAARRRARAKYGAVFDEHNTVLIGDTPRDVRAGHLGGAAVVAVATGTSSAAELEASGADVVLPDLGDTDMVAWSILEGRGSGAFPCAGADRGGGRRDRGPRPPAPEAGPSAGGPRDQSVHVRPRGQADPRAGGRHRGQTGPAGASGETTPPGAAPA